MRDPSSLILHPSSLTPSFFFIDFPLNHCYNIKRVNEEVVWASSYVLLKFEGLSLARKKKSRKERREQRQQRQQDYQRRAWNGAELRVHGAEAFRAEDYHEAIVCWARLYEREAPPDLARPLAEAYFRRGLGFYAENKLEQVISDLHWCVKLVPNDALYQFHLGLAYHRRGNMERALAHYGRALELEPTVDRFRYHFGLACIDSAAHLGAAVQMFSALARAEPSNPRWQFPLALIALKREDWDAAAAALETLKAHSDGHQAAAALLGLVHLRRGDPGQARAVLEQAAQQLARTDLSDAAARRTYGITLDYLGVARATDGDRRGALEAWERAYEVGLRATQLELNLAAAYRWAGVQALREGRLAEAVDRWERAQQLDGGDAQTRTDLSHLYFRYAHQLAQQEQLEKAVEYWERVAETDRRTEVLHNLALAYDRLEQPERAVSYWQRVIKDWEKQYRSQPTEALRQNLAMAHKHLGQSCLRIGQAERAQREFKQALEHSPKDWEAQKYLAEAYLEEGRYDEAIEFFEALLEESPDNVEALVNLGVAYDQAEMEEEALEAWESALEQQPDNAAARQHLTATVDDRVTYLLSIGRWPEAIEELKTRVECLPDDYVALGRIGDIYLQHNQPRRAEQYFEAALQIDPHNPRIPVLIGGSYLNVNQTQIAEDWFKRAEALSGQEPDVLLSIGIYYMRGRNPKAADQYFRRALKLAPDKKELPLTIAMLLFAGTHFRQAIEYFEEATDADPENAEAFHLMGHCYQAVNNRREAEDAFERALELAEDQGLEDLVDELHEDLEGGSELFRLLGGFPFFGR